MNEQIKILQEKLELKQKELDLVMSIDHIRDTIPEPAAMLSSIVNLLADELEAELCLLSLLDRESGEVSIKAINDRSANVAHLETFISHNLAERAIYLDKVTIWQGADILSSDEPPDTSKSLQAAAAPIMMGEDRLGALVLVRLNTPFSSNEIHLLKIAEDLIDSAIIQGYNYYTLQQRVKELKIIYRIDHIRDQNLPFDDMLNAVLQELSLSVESKMGLVMLYDPAGQKLEIRAATHKDLIYASYNYELIEKTAKESLQKAHLIQKDDLGSALRSIICLPLILNEQIIGVLAVVNHRDGRHFSAEDRRLLQAIGSQIDTAIFEGIEKRQLRQVLGRSVDPHIMERLLNSTDADFLRGERALLTVLYADLRGSTKLAERIAPEELVDFINHYLGKMTEVIFSHKGTLDKFVGDEVMALFGAPFPQEDHALRAVRAGLKMQEAHQKILDIQKERGLEAAPVGIGIATGELIVGEMGSPQRTDYTVIGRAANLGARICGAAKAGQVLISQATYDLVKKSVEATPITNLQFKGVDRDVIVYHVTKVLG